MKKFASMLALLLTLTVALSACGTDKAEVSINSDGYVVVNGTVTDIVADKDDVITVDDEGYVIVNGVKTTYKIHIKDEIVVNDDGYVVVNGTVTDIVADKDDVITVNGDGYVVVNGTVTDIVADKDDVITVDDDGYMVVNGVKTEYKVKKCNHNFGDWKPYSEGETDCEKLLYFRVCSDCAEIEWKDGAYEDHDWTVVTTQPNCQTGGFDTKTCNICGKVEVCNEVPVGGHSYPDVYGFDDLYHWRQCQLCGYLEAEQAHDPDYFSVCAVCNQLVSATEGISYTLSDDGAYAIVNSYWGTVTRVRIEKEYCGRPVTTIQDYAFYGCESLTHLVIPDSVTTIGEFAFVDCASLTRVTLGSGLITIGQSAFKNCTSLTGIVLPDSVTTIGDGAFYDCSGLTSVTLGSGITTTGQMVFQNCASLTSIVIPDNITIIGSQTFTGCISLTSVTWGGGVTTIGDRAFRNCPGLTNFVIPESVTTIGDGAFSWCANLTNIVIPESVTTIGSWAFSSCNSLKYIHYQGSTAQWQAIAKGEECIPNSCTIRCTDGNTWQ